MPRHFLILLLQPDICSTKIPFLRQIFAELKKLKLFFPLKYVFFFFLPYIYSQLPPLHTEFDLLLAAELSLAARVSEPEVLSPKTCSLAHSTDHRAASFASKV